MIRGYINKASMLLAVVLLIASALPGCSAGQLDSLRPSGTNRSADKMPEFSLKDTSGNLVSSAQFKGKVLIVDFWATWCPPCRVEMPHFQELYEKYKDRGLEIIGISLDVDPEDVKEYVKEIGINYTILMADNKVQKAFGGLLGLPTTFVIDRKGNIYKKYIGFTEKKEFERAVAELLPNK